MVGLGMPSQAASQQPAVCRSTFPALGLEPAPGCACGPRWCSAGLSWCTRLCPSSCPASCRANGGSSSRSSPFTWVSRSRQAAKVLPLALGKGAAPLEELRTDWSPDCVFVGLCVLAAQLAPSSIGLAAEALDPHMPQLLDLDASGEAGSSMPVCYTLGVPPGLSAARRRLRVGTGRSGFQRSGQQRTGAVAASPLGPISRRGAAAGGQGSARDPCRASHPAGENPRGLFGPLHGRMT